MNRTQTSARGRQGRGAVKETIGKLTGDRTLEGDGKIDKGLGKVQKKLADVTTPRRRTTTTTRTSTTTRAR